MLYQVKWYCRIISEWCQGWETLRGRGGRICQYNTETFRQHRSDCNIELVRFFNSLGGDGAYTVFASIQLLYRNNTLHDHPSKFAHH